MCVSIPLHNLNITVTPSATLAMIYLTNEFMNPALEDGSIKPMNCLEAFGRRVFGLLAYPALCVAALVEAAVRLVLALVAFIPSLCCDNEKIFNLVLENGICALVTFVDAPLRTISALYHKVIMDTEVTRDARVNRTTGEIMRPEYKEPAKYKDLHFFNIFP